MTDPKHGYDTFMGMFKLYMQYHGPYINSFRGKVMSDKQYIYRVHHNIILVLDPSDEIIDGTKKKIKLVRMIDMLAVDSCILVYDPLFLSVQVYEVGDYYLLSDHRRLTTKYIDNILAPFGNRCEDGRFYNQVAGVKYFLNDAYMSFSDRIDNMFVMKNGRLEGNIYLFDSGGKTTHMKTFADGQQIGDVQFATEHDLPIKTAKDALALVETMDAYLDLYDIKPA